MRSRSILVMAALIAVGPVLAGCESFDVDKLDLFNLSDKKKLPGERKALFPEGVPGATQGIPPELVKGYKPPEVAEEPPPAVEPPKPAPKARVVRRTPKPTPITVQRQQQPQVQQQQQQPQQAQQQPQQSWPSPQPQAQPQQAGQPAWPAPPPSNTFQR